MGVQKPGKKSSYPNLRFENNGENAATDVKDSSAEDTRLSFGGILVCSNCLTSTEKCDDDLIKFHDKLLCEGCLRTHISSHYRRKFLKDITFDLRQINQVRPLLSTKHQSLTLESLSLKSTSTDTTSDERPKSCSDSFMELHNSNSESKKVSETLDNTETCPKCQFPYTSSSAVTSEAHDCVATLKETLMEVQNTLEVFKSRCKEQIRAFLQRESNLINHMVSIQSEMLVQNKKNKSKIQKLELQNAELLAKVSFVYVLFQGTTLEFWNNLFDFSKMKPVF